MGEQIPCSASTDDDVYSPCRNGFPQTGPCWGIAGTPICCNEEVCGRLYDKWGGRPPQQLETSP